MLVKLAVKVLFIQSHIEFAPGARNCLWGFHEDPNRTFQRIEGSCSGINPLSIARKLVEPFSADQRPLLVYQDEEIVGGDTQKGLLYSKFMLYAFDTSSLQMKIKGFVPRVFGEPGENYGYLRLALDKLLTTKDLEFHPNGVWDGKAY